MRRILEIAYTGLVAATIHPLRSAVTAICLVAVFTPYSAGVAITHGVRSEAEIAIAEGADLYVSNLKFGKRGPVPAELVNEVATIDGVTAVYPRIVGEVFLGADSLDAVLVGVPVDRIPESIAIVEGRLPKSSPVHEFVVGSELARQLNLRVGSYLPPFYKSSQGERVSKVVGIFRSAISLWQANLILTTFTTAAHIFDQPTQATELLVEVRPGYGERVREHLLRHWNAASSEPSAGQLEVTTRRDMRAFLPRGWLHREGVFNLHFVPVIVSLVLVVLVSSGTGLSERRREVGILKATGWQTDEILLRSLAESVVIALTGAMVALLAAFLWLRVFNGYWIAGVLLGGVGRVPSMNVPYLLLPTPALLTVVLSLAVVLAGNLFCSWRAAIAAPHAAMR